MVHDHGGHTHDHEPHGGARGLGWDVLDSVMLACAVVITALLSEQLWKWWQQRKDGVRYDLTPEGLAATTPPRTGEGESLVDLDALAEAVKRGDLGEDKPTE